MIYDGDGKIIRWLIVTDGKLLTPEWTETHCPDVVFLISHDGKMSSTTLKNALIFIKR